MFYYSQLIHERITIEDLETWKRGVKEIKIYDDYSNNYIVIPIISVIFCNPEILPTYYFVFCLLFNCMFKIGPFNMKKYWKQML